jgi:large conductance mechanosensitive channel
MRCKHVLESENQGEEMSIVKEFKEFAVKGNVMDLAVGVIIGGAFGKIIDSVVNDLVMPIVSAIIGKPDFSGLYVVLGSIPPGTANTLADLRKAGVPVFAYGSFLTVLLNFLLLAVVVFIMVKQMNRLKRQEAPAPTAAPATPEDIVLLREIRDSLRR